MLEIWIFYWLGVGVWCSLTFYRLKAFLHILQLEEYFTAQYVRWLSANPPRYLRTMAGVAVVPVVAVLVLVASTLLGAVALAVWLAIGVLAEVKRPRPTARKPLVLTARARRAWFTAAALAAAAIALATALGLLAGERDGIAAGVVVASLLCAAAGHVLALANVLLYPFEAASRRKFEVQASRKLAERAPKVIAITGSAGKTTTKELVAHLLSARFRVLRTPASFNTPMGIARTVNDGLTDQECFVVEMGAYKRGEIERLCRLVGGTDISVITTVNAQHLERFGSLAKTAATKFEIVEGLKPGGSAILNFDVPAIRERAQRHAGIELLSFGVDYEDVRLRARNVRETEAGIEFDVTYGGETAPMRTNLLARHNVTNVLAALGVGLTCGLDLPYMAAALRQFHSPEHRLQPMKLPTGGIVIDDAYNANPAGIIGALQVLGAYAPKRRIVVTPGLIEMGRDKQRYHAEIGAVAAKQVDIAVLVGPKQTADIKAGMVASGFPESSLHTVRGLDEARAYLASIAAGGPDDVILYANDLPDQYDEFLEI